ncbi:hypothetical protein L6164_022503 [Bauhinia variegata]|uniref:Uncharacterized protein n=1 Tax=Bauhinia variegata TaxID=167791 RepID=A0ACB9MH61_BAUVA|nr:hypothetical protein L6164_022503 [Bauhinia variegata]
MKFNDEEVKHVKKTRLILIVAATTITATLGMIFISFYYIYKVPRNLKDKQNVEADEDDLDLPLIESSKITNATHNFSIMNKIGEGGFGPVYKGRLEDGQEIAVKKLSSRSTQGTTEFKNETIAIVLLVMHGYCGKRTRPWN